MNRREYLTASGTGLLIAVAGCAETPWSNNSTNDPTQQDARITNTDTNLESELQYSISLTQPARNDREPLRLEVQIKNTSEDTAYVYGEQRAAVFRAASTNDFVLYPTEQANKGADGAPMYEYNQSENVWVATDSFAMTMEYAIGTLEPGETVTQNLTLLHEHITAPHRDPEAYPSELTFTSSITVSPDENPNDTDYPNLSDGTQTDIRFTVEFPTS